MSPPKIGLVVAGALFLIVAARTCSARRETPAARATARVAPPGDRAAETMVGVKMVGAAFTSSAQAFRRELGAGWARWQASRAPFSLRLIFDADCAHTSFSRALESMHRGEQRILAELRPISCGELTATVAHITTTELEHGEMTLPFSVATRTRCTASLEVCAMPSTADGRCADAPSDRLFVSRLLVVEPQMTRIYTGRTRRGDEGAALASAEIPDTSEARDMVRRSRGGSGEVYGERSYGVRLGYFDKAICEVAR